MTNGAGAPEPLVRREVVEVLRRLDPFRTHPDLITAGIRTLSPRDMALLATATKEELRAAAREALADLAMFGNVVVMGDGSLAVLPDDPDWKRGTT